MPHDFLAMSTGVVCLCVQFRTHKTQLLIFTLRAPLSYWCQWHCHPHDPNLSAILNPPPSLLSSLWPVAKCARFCLPDNSCSNASLLSPLPCPGSGHPYLTTSVVKWAWTSVLGLIPGSNNFLPTWPLASHDSPSLSTGEKMRGLTRNAMHSASGPSGDPSQHQHSFSSLEHPPRSRSPFFQGFSSPIWVLHHCQVNSYKAKLCHPHAQSCEYLPLTA